MKDEKREQLRKFLQSLIDGDLQREGEDAIESWMVKVEPNENYADIYKLSEADKQQMRLIGDEYFAAREREEAMREKRRLAEEEADRIMANHYANRIRKIVLNGMDKKWLPKPNASVRRKSH